MKKMNELVQKAEELAAAFGVGLKDLGEYIVAHTTGSELPAHTAPLTPTAPVTVIVGYGLGAAANPGQAGTNTSEASSTEPQPTGEGQ